MIDFSRYNNAFLARFGEVVTYLPRGGRPRDIMAIVDRESVEQISNGRVTYAQVIRITTPNNSEKGIDTHCLDAGGDKIKVSRRIGDAAELRSIAKINYQDNGMVQVELS